MTVEKAAKQLVKLMKAESPCCPKKIVGRLLSSGFSQRNIENAIVYMISKNKIRIDKDLQFTKGTMK